MKSDRLLFILIALLSAALRCHAQYYSHNRIITTDYNECMTGVKDTSGNWIIPPKYREVVRVSRNGFVVHAGTKCGLLDSNGQEIFSTVWDAINETRAPGFFEVSQNEHYGILSVHRDTIVPVVYAIVSAMDDSVFFARNQHKKWTMFDMKGQTKVVPFRTKYQPRYLCKGLYRMTRSRGTLRNKYGIIDDSAHIVLPRKYDGIQESDADLVFVQDGYKGGYLSEQGQFVWPVIYTCYALPTNYTLDYYDRSEFWEYDMAYENIFYKDTIGVAQLNGKYGLVTASGRTLLEVKYDFISESKEGDDKSQVVWGVELNGKQGLYHAKQGWLLNPELDNLTVIDIYKDETDSSMVCSYRGQKDGKWGASTTTGQVLVPWNYTHSVNGNTGYLFYNTDTIVRLDNYSPFLKKLVVKNQLGVRADSTLPYFDRSTRVREIPHSGKFSSYTAAGGTKVFYHPDHTQDSLYILGRAFGCQPKNNLTDIPDSILVSAAVVIEYMVPIVKIGTEHQLYRDTLVENKYSQSTFSMFVKHQNDSSIDAILYRYSDGTYTYYQTASRFLFRSDGKILAEPGQWYKISALQCERPGALQFVAMNPGPVTAVLDTAGKQIVEADKCEIESFGTKYMWKNIRPTHSEFDWFFKPKYELTNRTTGEKIPMPKKIDDDPTLLWGNMTTFYTDKTGHRLYDLDKREFVSTGYNTIFSLNDSGTVFLIGTCFGRTGVIDNNGKLLLDTLYTYCAPFNAQRSFCTLRNNSYFNVYYDYYALYSFYNDSVSVLFDAVSGKIVNDSALSSYFFSRMLVFPDTLSQKLQARESNMRAYSNESFYTMFRSDSARLAGWQIENLVDTLRQPRRSDNGDDYSFNDRVYFCRYCQERNNNLSAALPDASGNHFRIRYVGDSMISYRKLTNYDRMNQFTNVFLFSDGARNMTLDSLFDPTGDWRNFVINSVMSYINSHLYIDGDCHNPAAFPKMLNERFLVSEKGIELYPNEFTERSLQLVITIPWEAAHSYLRADVKTKIPGTS